MESALKGNGWIICYPIYLDAKKTIAEGRRVPKEKAVENPTFDEVQMCLQALKLEHVGFPDKAYPRDFLQQGMFRIRVQDANGAKLYTRQTLWLKLAEMIPSLETRNNTNTTAAKKKKKN
jgi:signal recognition particle subunit SRP19